MAAEICIPTNRVQGFLSSHPWQHLLFNDHRKSDFNLMLGYLRKNLRSRMIFQEYKKRLSCLFLSPRIKPADELQVYPNV